MRRLAPALASVALAACGTAAAHAPSGYVSPTKAKGSGIAGRVVTGPTCPVERIPPDPRCAPRPLQATLRIDSVGAGGHASGAVVHTGPSGRFHTGLAPGTYVVNPLARRGSTVPRPPAPIRVRVTAGHFTFVTIAYDSGIR